MSTIETTLDPLVQLERRVYALADEQGLEPPLTNREAVSILGLVLRSPVVDSQDEECRYDIAMVTVRGVEADARSVSLRGIRMALQGELREASSFIA